MNGPRIDPAMAAGAAYALAAMGRRDPTDADIGGLVERFGPGAVHVALQVQARLIEAEADALEAFSVIRHAQRRER